MFTKYIKSFLIALTSIIFIYVISGVNINASQSNIDLSQYYCETDTIYDMSDASNITPFLDSSNNELTIDDYKEKLLGLNILGNKRGIHLEYNVLDDDPIINIVPRECFTSIGSYFKDGDAYAYYVKTTTKNATNYMHIEDTLRTYFRSDVLIIDYESNVDEINYNFNESYIKQSLNVHQYVFYTIKLDSEIIYLPTVFDIIDFSVDSNFDKNNIIIPVPKLGVNNYIFDETASNLNVRSNSAYISMENEHDSNENNGRFLVAAFAKYNGYEEANTTNEKPNVYEVLTNVISLGLSFSTSFGGVSTIISVYGVVGELFDLWLTKNYTYNVETSNENMFKQIKLLELFKESQISTYGRLIKDILFIGDTKNIKMFYNGNYMEYGFGFGCDSGDATSTTFNSTIMYDIYDDNNILQSVAHTDSFRLIDETNKELEVGVTLENEYNMLGTSQTYYFYSNNSQNYKIYVGMGQTLNVYDSLGNEIISNGNYYYLENDKKYNIVVSNFSGLDVEYSITIDYPDVGNEIEVPSYSVYYLRYIPSESNVYFIDGINTYYNGTAKDIAFLNKDERYEIEVTNYSSSNLVIIPNILIPRESGTKYIYEDIQLSGDYIINSDNQCYVVINNKIRDIITGEIIYLNATKVYSKSEIAVESANCSYIPYLNGEEIISKGINRIMLADDIIITVRRYQDGEYVSDYNGFVIKQELPNTMDASVYEITLKNIPNRPDFEFVLAPLNPIIAEITFDKLIDEEDINISIGIRFEENFNGVIKGTVGEKKYEFKVLNGYLSKTITLQFESIQFDKYNELIMFLYAQYNKNNQGEQYMLLSKEECMISLDSNILIDYLLSPDFSYDYMNYLHNTVNASNNYNTVVNKYKSYILSTIKKEWVNNICYNNIRHELQLLAMLENYELNMEISFDDGINYDSYIFGDAIIQNIRIMKDLYYKNDCKFFVHSSYLYAVFKGLGHEIYNLHLEQNSLFIANYGEMHNIRFVECSFRNVFSTYGYGIERDVDFIYHIVGE